MDKTFLMFKDSPVSPLGYLPIIGLIRRYSTKVVHTVAFHDCCACATAITKYTTAAFDVRWRLKKVVAWKTIRQITYRLELESGRVQAVILC